MSYTEDARAESTTSGYVEMDDPKRDTETRTAVTGLEKTAAEADQLVEMIEQRLYPVLRSAPPEVDGAELARAIETQHATELTGIAGHLRRTNARLRSVLDRLEI